MALFGSNKNVTELVITGDNKSARKAISQITNDLDRAEREIGKMSRGWGNVIGAIGNVNPIYLAGGAALAAAGGFTALIAKTIQAGEELYKMSGRTGLSVEQLSALQKTSERTGISFDDLLKLYKSGNKQLTDMVDNLIKVGDVMSTKTARDAAIAKTEWEGFTDVLDQLASKTFDFLMGSMGRLAYIMKNFGTDAASIARGIAFLIEVPEAYNIWIKNIQAAADAQNKQNQSLQTAVDKLKEHNREKEKFISRIEKQKQQAAAQRRNGYTGEIAGAMIQTDYSLELASYYGFTMQMIDMTNMRKDAIMEISFLEQANLAALDGTASQVFGNMADAAGMFYELSGQKSKEWFDIQKGFSIAQAVINTYEGATKALAQGGIFGPILAASVIAFGLAQVAAIAAQQPGGGYGGGGGSYAAPSIPREPRSVSNDNSKTVIINYYGGFWENKDKFARDIVPSIRKAIGDGV